MRNKNKPVISRKRTKTTDIERLRGALSLAKNNKIFETIGDLRPHRFQEKFVRSAFLKAYITRAEMDLLFKVGWVKSTSGKTVKAWRPEHPAFLKAYPNLAKRIDKAINERLAFLNKHGYKIDYNIRRTKKEDQK